MRAVFERSLKSRNFKWLVLLAVLDIVLAVLFVAPELLQRGSLTGFVAMRALGTTVMPVVVLMLTGLLPADIKAMLVYWRATNPLPGCEAFTKHAPADPRIDMGALKRHTGAIPSEPREQNAKWYKLYKMVADDHAVAEAHKTYLLYRDMAAMSLPLIFLVPLGLLMAGTSPNACWTAVGIFALQFIVCALGARHSGIRLVCSVLALHSARKVLARTR